VTLAVATKPGKIRADVRGELGDCLRRLRNWTGPREVLEVLVEGPRGTGKSRGVDTFLHWIATTYPGAKILVVRKTRQSLTESFCKTFEEDVLGPVARRLIVGDGDRGNRSHYQYPNGSRIALVGLDRPSKHQSTDWDVIVLEEASELTWRQVMPFFGALRNFVKGIPWQLLIAPTNPDAPRNWLNVRANEGKMMRVVTRHRDNPKWFDNDVETPEGEAFLKSLERYTGVERDRHVLGLWRGAEGMVWENFDERIHVIDEPNWRSSLKIVEYRGAMDWGTTHPGCFQVWGIDAAKRMTLVATIQQTGKTPDWWSARAVELIQEFQIRRVVADPSQPGFMTQINDWLTARGAKRIVYPANNKKASSGSGDMGGLALVRWGLERDSAGVPRIRMLRNALRGPADPALVAESKPTWVAEEIPSYVHARDASGEFMYETTDKDLPDDGCDTMRYAATDNWGLSPVAPPLPPEPKPEPWTNAWQFGTPKTLEMARIARENGDDDDGG
jgi:phage terminase large subunit